MENASSDNAAKLMCGRYTLTVIEGFEDFFEIDERVQLEPRYNIAPTQSVPVVIRRNENIRQLRMMHWGLIPAWSNGPGPNPARLINARSETADSKTSFREAFSQRRCLVPADGFYEWRSEGRRKIPIHFSLKNNGLFAFAGLWEHWRGEDDRNLESTTILTTEANPLVSQIHDRMPVILTRERFRPWLEPGTPGAVLEGLMSPLDATAMHCKRVSQKVNSSRTEGPELFEENATWRQRGLF